MAHINISIPARAVCSVCNSELKGKLIMPVDKAVNEIVIEPCQKCK